MLLRRAVQLVVIAAQLAQLGFLGLLPLLQVFHGGVSSHPLSVLQASIIDNLRIDV